MTAPTTVSVERQIETLTKQRDRHRAFIEVLAQEQRLSGRIGDHPTDTARAAREHLGPGETYDKPREGWICYHCGERFVTPGSAAIHFGPKPTSVVLCKLRGAEYDTAKALRDAEAQLAALTKERDEAERVAQVRLRTHEKDMEILAAISTENERLKAMLDSVLNLYDPGPHPISDVIKLLHEACEATASIHSPSMEGEKR